MIMRLSAHSNLASCWYSVCQHNSTLLEEYFEMGFLKTFCLVWVFLFYLFYMSSPFSNFGSRTCVCLCTRPGARNYVKEPFTTPKTRLDITTTVQQFVGVGAWYCEFLFSRFYSTCASDPFLECVSHSHLAHPVSSFLLTVGSLFLHRPENKVKKD